ncbi:SCO family protein [Arhodomonas aquaeolei]|uniref:SCO family protein n=1 Tax=Arhodomonas aquaeolei TaxID=2369 RepID=UPI00039F3857|nr:SCO family protein [Arhodomonas aquaeolei]
MREMRTAAVTAMLALLLVACTSGDWRTKDISGMMPELAFNLTNENGQSVTAEDYRGKVTLLFFGYTFCPDVCPVTLARLSRILGKLDEDARRDVQVLFVSVDPRRDTPERLRAYTSAFGKDFIGLTGTQDQLKALNKRYRVTYGYGEPDENGNYVVSHSGAVFVFNRAGEARLLVRDSDPVEAVLADLRRIIESG